MTPQEIFNKVAAHLVKQGHRSMGVGDHSGDCQYRAANGDMCAVGCLIPEDKYSGVMEGIAVCDMGRAGYDFDIPAYFNDNLSLLNDLQFLHDTVRVWKTPETLIAALNEVANEYKFDQYVPT